MNASHPPRLVLAALTALALVALGRPVALALEPRLEARPLTHGEIAELGLAEGTQAATGLFTVGVGQPVYLEVLVDKALPASNLVSVAWALASRPDGSAAALTASPLGAGVPPYEPSDRLDFRVAGRQLLRPDQTGEYKVNATLSTNGGSLVLSRYVVAGKYMGVGYCTECHTGRPKPDTVTPWSKTGHATMFTEALDGLKSSHYGSNCISCHTLGYDTALTATNGGFDDVARKLGWAFPPVLTNGNWAALPSALKALSNIQCENCHGAGSEHYISYGQQDTISTTLGSGVCAQCHDEGPYHVKNLEWAASRHAVAVREERSDCVGCHQGPGFIDRMNNKPSLRLDYTAINCTICHEPHSAANPHQVRSVRDVTLMDTSRPGGATVVTNGGSGKLCMQCHISRRDAVTYVEGPANSRFGPHHGPQTDMLAGANAITYGKEIPSSGHLAAVKDSCATCHMQATDLTSPAHLHAGGHTFYPAWDGGTPDDPADDLQLVGACMACHGPIRSFDFARYDYDGDGLLDGVQTTVQKLLNELALLLPPEGPEVVVDSSYTAAQKKAVFNYLFVLEDGSKGIHNPTYAVGLLKAAIADLTDDADKDGLKDSWEIAQFGSIQAQNAQSDADADGLSNAMEQAAGTSLTAADSDGDGHPDQAEMAAGSDPLNAADTPGSVVKVLKAAELEFASEPGKTYRIQKVSELLGTWEDVGTNIVGTGGMITHLIPTRTASAEYYRIKQVP